MAYLARKAYKPASYEACVGSVLLEYSQALRRGEQADARDYFSRVTRQFPGANRRELALIFVAVESSRARPAKSTGRAK